MNDMAVFTVHEPPLRPADPVPDLERALFVRDGFSFWAFLFGPLWMLRHRMWLVLAAYLVLAGGLQAVLLALGASPAAIIAAGLLIALLVGLEAGTLRRLTLRRRRWKEVGLVGGNDREVAERRFFAAWRLAAARPAAARAGAPLQLRTPAAQAPAVVGLFPEPGAHR
jgi:hypothetical protein